VKILFSFLYAAFLKESCIKNFAHCDNSCLTSFAVRLPGNSALQYREKL